MSAAERRRSALVACLVACLAAGACGGATPAPRSPAPPDPKLVAQELHLSLNEMAAIVQRRRADCDRMAIELRELFVRMRASVERAQRMADDPALAKQLADELRAYDDVDRGLAKRIFADLVACKDHRGVQDAMATMPVMPMQ